MKQKQSKRRSESTREERESYGRWARRVWLVIKENQAAAGIPIGGTDSTSWAELSDAEKEVFCQSGIDLSGGATRREQAIWDELARRRAAMGEKAFLSMMFGLCVANAVECIAPQATESDRERTVDVIVRMAIGMANDFIRADGAESKVAADAVERPDAG